MAKSKTSQKAATSDGKRKETKEERRQRLKDQEAAREACFKALPYVGGVVLLCVVLFALYVRSVPAKLPVSLNASAQEAIDLQQSFVDKMQEGLDAATTKVKDAVDGVTGNDGESAGTAADDVNPDQQQAASASSSDASSSDTDEHMEL